MDDITQDYIAKLKQENFLRKRQVEIAMETLKFIHDKTFTDPSEGPELRARAAIIHVETKEAIIKLKEIR